MICNIRNINWSSPEILMDLPTTQISASADIWSLAMVISEICNGEVPYDSQECRQMSLDSFIAHLRAGHRPQLFKEFSHLAWLNEMVRLVCFVRALYFERISCAGIAGRLLPLLLANGVFFFLPLLLLISVGVRLVFRRHRSVYLRRNVP